MNNQQIGYLYGQEKIANELIQIQQAQQSKKKKGKKEKENKK